MTPSQSTDDLVKRLRLWVETCESNDLLEGATFDIDNAADTIERLQAEAKSAKDRMWETGRENERLQREQDLAWQMLGHYGVSKERGKNVPTAINVLVTRMDRELAARDKTIERYAGHDDDCNAVRQGGELRSPPVPCSCGYASPKGDNGNQSPVRDKLSVVVIRALTKAQEELIIVETEIGVPSEALPLIQLALAARSEERKP